MKLRSNIDLGASFERLKSRFNEIKNSEHIANSVFKHSWQAGRYEALIELHLKECTESEDDLKDLDVFSSPGNSQTETEILGEMELHRTPDNMHPPLKDYIFEALSSALRPSLKPDELAEYSEDVLPRKDYPRNTNNDLQDDAGNGNFQF